VDLDRFNRFFDALSFGIIYKTTRQQLPAGYNVSHVYHSLHQDLPPEVAAIHAAVQTFYRENAAPPKALRLGQLKLFNEPIYAANVFGRPNFGGSITLTHRFFGSFEVTSMLSLSL
jgi:hypothetical protein